MKLMDEFSTAGQAAFKTTTVVIKGGYHAASIVTDAIIRERKKSALNGEMELQDIVNEAVKQGMDDDVAWATCAAIEAEI